MTSVKFVQIIVISPLFYQMLIWFILRDFKKMSAEIFCLSLIFLKENSKFGFLFFLKLKNVNFYRSRRHLLKLITFLRSIKSSRNFSHLFKSCAILTHAQNVISGRLRKTPLIMLILSGTCDEYVLLVKIGESFYNFL